MNIHIYIQVCVCVYIYSNDVICMYMYLYMHMYKYICLYLYMLCACLSWRRPFQSASPPPPPSSKPTAKAGAPPSIPPAAATPRARRAGGLQTGLLPPCCSPGITAVTYQSCRGGVNSAVLCQGLWDLRQINCILFVWDDAGCAADFFFFFFLCFVKCFQCLLSHIDNVLTVMKRLFWYSAIAFTLCDSVIFSVVLSLLLCYVGIK